MRPINTFRKTAITLAISQAVILSSEAATIEVNTNLDAIDPNEIAGCTLRKAIDSLDSGALVTGCAATGNALGDNDTIVFANNLAGSTITLAGQALNVNSSNQVSNITIQGDGVRISANAQSSILDLKNGNFLTLNNIRLSNGGNTAFAGAITVSSGATLSLSDCTITRNAGRFAGAIGATNSNVEINDCVISLNSVEANTATGGGGLRLSDSTTVLNNVTITSNRSFPNGGGIELIGGTLDVINSNISNNRALGSSILSARGGGLSSLNSTVSITDSTLSGNSAPDGGGGVFIENSIVSIDKSSLSSNSTNTVGGAISARSSGSLVTIDNSTLSANLSGTSGGALHGTSSLDFVIRNSTISGNSAGGSGAGMFIAGDTELLHSTVTNNSAASNGGGLFLQRGNVEIANNLIANNSSNRATEFYFVSATLINSGVNLFGTTVAEPFNGLFSPASTDIVVDISNPDKLGSLILPLTNNGGPTLTHALPAGSAAINTANASVCNTDLINKRDQRGIERDNRCDIGAFEFVAEESFFVVPTKNGKTVIFEL